MVGTIMDMEEYFLGHWEWGEYENYRILEFVNIWCVTNL